MLIVDRYPVASRVLCVPLAFQPANILPNQIIVLERRLFQPRISIIEPQKKASLVHPRIVVGEDYRPDRTQVQDEVWVRREPRHNHRILVCVRQRRQALGAGLALRRYCLDRHEQEASQLDSILIPQKERSDPTSCTKRVARMKIAMINSRFSKKTNLECIRETLVGQQNSHRIYWYARARIDQPKLGSNPRGTNPRGELETPFFVT